MHFDKLGCDEPAYTIPVECVELHCTTRSLHPHEPISTQRVVMCAHMGDSSQERCALTEDAILVWLVRRAHKSTCGNQRLQSSP